MEEERSTYNFYIIKDTTFAILHRSGKIPVLNDKLMILARLLEKKSLLIFNIYIGMLLGPSDLFKSNEFMMSKISSGIIDTYCL